MRSKTVGCLLAATVPTFVTFYAYAQEGGGLEEIVVTATRREQNLQDVPISIVAVTGDTLQMRGLDSLERVSQAIPNLIVTGGGGGTGQTNFTVRGIPNVGTYVDGVWQVGTNGLLDRGFVDIDRIEVLRGPQGTEFGRDSTGGAIRIWTKKPSDTSTTPTSPRRSARTTGTTCRHRSICRSPTSCSREFTGASLNRDGYIDEPHDRCSRRQHRSADLPRRHAVDADRQADLALQLSVRQQSVHRAAHPGRRVQGNVSAGGSSRRRSGPLRGRGCRRLSTRSQ